MKIVAGIDYSMTSPAICVHQGDEWLYKNCRMFYRTDTKKYAGVMAPNLIGDEMQPHNSQEERFYQNAKWAIRILKLYDPSFIIIEGYAMGAKGKVFHIGEHTGVLKHCLWNAGFKFDVVPPTVVKKMATGSGAANKERMDLAFQAETSDNLRQKLRQSEASFTPSGDCVDAYYMCKTAFNKTQ